MEIDLEEEKEKSLEDIALCYECAIVLNPAQIEPKYAKPLKYLLRRTKTCVEKAESPTFITLWRLQK